MMYTDPALRWLEVVLTERFGHEFQLSFTGGHLQMRLNERQGTIIFDSPDPAFHQSRSDFPCFEWFPRKEGFEASDARALPAPASHPLVSPLVELGPEEAVVHYDVPGLTIWMLTRQEEIGRTDLDEHRRFPATSSHAYHHDYLERPIVDEWLAVLGQIIGRVWPDITLKHHRFSVKVSHDVDRPARYAFQSFAGLIRTLGGDVLVRRDIKSAIMAPFLWLNSRRTHAIQREDPFNTFTWLMDQSEKYGLTSAFYFICGRTDSSKDALYDPEMPEIRQLIRTIHSRGHEIGLHPSYNTYNRPAEIAREAERLRRVCAEEGVTQRGWGGRMHFLRWDQATTLRAWNDAGMTYDSTMSYADRPGFRCGTCFEYPAFDVVEQRALGIRVRPLVAMDCTVIAERYLGLGSTEAAFQKFNALKDECRKVGGTFTLLWHNSYFGSEQDFRIYSRLLSDEEAALRKKD